MVVLYLRHTYCLKTCSNRLGKVIINISGASAFVQDVCPEVVRPKCSS